MLSARFARVFVAGCAGLALQASVVSSLAKPTLEERLVITQVPRNAEQPEGTQSESDLTREDLFNQARIILVTPGGEIKKLTDGFYSACDPSISFDGKQMLFAGKKSQTSSWRIYEMNVDGTGVRPVTPEGQDARQPLYVSTLFTLNSPEPWYTLVYSATEGTLNEKGRPGTSSIYNIKLDGTEMRRLTFNPNRNFDPFQLWNGRVVYAAERRPLEAGTGGSRVGLYEMHIEGADLEFFGAGQARKIQHMPCATHKGTIVFVEMDMISRDGAGQLSCVHESRPHVSYRRLTEESPDFAYLYPAPYRDNIVLVSRRSSDFSSNCGLFLYDIDKRTAEPLFDDPDYNDLQVKVLRSVPAPDGHSTVVNTKTNIAALYGLNSYLTDAKMQGHLPPGTVKRIRLIEGVPMPSQNGLTSKANGIYVPRRLVGEAYVEPDGSFNVEVPPSIPLLLQTLDERGMALATCGWIWLQPRENRGCIGCHEDPERIPENEYVQALRRPPNKLALPPSQRRAISFKKDVMPILSVHCASASCHGNPQAPFRLPENSAASSDDVIAQLYQSLLSPLSHTTEASPASGRYIDAGRSRTSFLIWQLFGTNTSRPWDKSLAPESSVSRKIKLMPPTGKGKPLSEDKLKTIIQWIDTGAEFSDSAATSIDPVKTTKPQ